MSSLRSGLLFRVVSVRRTSCLALATVAAVLSSNATLADPPVPMAPPINIGSQTTGNNASSSVFTWSDIPVNQQVPIQRAIFDQGGYQLYDTVGETIVVPFTNQNLYVMKFAISPDGSTFFVNDNGTPTFYLPQNGFITNATVPGARWYPFSAQFHPNQPVYVGIAPSYTAFINEGWYPDTIIYGGYYSRRASVVGNFFLSSPGFSIFIGNEPYFGWNNYHQYAYNHHAPYHVQYYNSVTNTVFNRIEINNNSRMINNHTNLYRYASHQNHTTNNFNGSTGHGGSFSGGIRQNRPSFNGSGRTGTGQNRSLFRGGGNGNSTFSGNPRVFRGLQNNPGQNGTNRGIATGGRTFRGGDSRTVAIPTVRGNAGQPTNTSRPTFRGGGTSNGGGRFQGARGGVNKWWRSSDV